MSTHPTTFADLAAAGWTPGGVGAAGHLFRSIKIGPYEITAYTDGGGVSLERRDGAIQISEADTVVLATKIAVLLRGETGAALAEAQAENAALRADLATTKTRIEEAHKALDEAGIERDWLSRRVKASIAERDTARTEAETLRARLRVETEARRRALSALASALSVDADNNDTDRLIEAANAAASHIKAGTETVNRLDFTVSKLEVDLAKAEARFTEIYADLQQQIKAAHAMFDEADVEGCLGVLADRVKALAVDRGRAINALEAVTKERDAARTDLAKMQGEREYLNSILSAAEEGQDKAEAKNSELRAERDTLRVELNRANMEALNADASAPVYRHAVDQLRAYLSQRTGVDHTGADIVSAVVRELQGCVETVRALQDRLDIAEKRITRAEGIALEQLRHRLRGD